MKDEAMTLKAKAVYQQLKDALDRKGWEYRAVDEDLVIVSDYTGEDVPIRFLFRVDKDRQCLTFHTSEFATFEQKDYLDATLAICVANHGMTFGHFDFDMTKGSVFYTMSNSFVGADLGEEFFLAMLATAVITVDRYNDRFIMLSKGLIDFKQFVSLE